MNSKRDIRPVIDITVAVIVFWVMNDLIPIELPGIGGVLIEAGVSLVVAVLIPTFAYGLPKIEAQWTLAGELVEEGPYQLDLRNRNEESFVLDVSVAAGSLMGWVLLKRAVKHGTVLKVTMRPEGVLRLKKQTCLAGAQIDSTSGEIRIPITSSRGTQHSRAMGAFVPQAVNPGSDRVNLVHEAEKTTGTRKPRWASVSSPLNLMRVRTDR